MEHEIHPKEYGELNAAYYSEAPTSYFRTRLSLALALCDPTQPLDRVFESGVSYAGASATSPAGTSEELEGYATVEFLSLEHLVAETLLRQYLAHVDQPFCPALEMARLTSFRVFKDLVRNEILNVAPDDRWLGKLRVVFRGSTSRRDFADVSEDVWASDGEYLSTLLKSGADIVINGARAYNSYKHGLGIQTSRPYLKIGKPGSYEEVLLEHTGPAVSYLHRERTALGDPEWVRSTAFVSLEVSIGRTVLFLEELDSLWSVARGTYLAENVKVTFQQSERFRLLGSRNFHRGVSALVMSQRFQRPRVRP